MTPSLPRCLFLAVAGLAAALAASAAELRKPNIVLILADDLGYGDLSCYNPKTGVATPNIDRLAAEGVRFNQFYSAGNVCSPSRRALLTGRYPSRLGEWAEAYACPPGCADVSAEAAPVFARYLKQAGYATGSFGKWNIGEAPGVSTPEAQGFDYWIGSFHNHSYFAHRRDQGTKDFWENGVLAPQYEGRYSDDIFIERAMDFIRAQRSKPFFVYLPICTPHTPFQDPDEPEDNERAARWNRADGKKEKPPQPSDRPLLAKMVRHVDARLGELFRLLAAFGLEQNTLVILTSDNGGTPASINAPLRGFKQGMLEGGIRVPTLIKWPGVYPAGRVSEQVGIGMDLAATIVAAAGATPFIRTGHAFDGIDLTPIVTGAQGESERALGWRRRNWSLAPAGINDVWAEAYRKGRWKYLKEFKEAPAFARSITSAYPTEGYVEMLFDLGADQGEQTDLARRHPEKLTELRTEFEAWKERVVNKTSRFIVPFPDQYARTGTARP
jgi:arylsulfatase A-like enzyme